MLTDTFWAMDSARVGEVISLQGRATLELQTSARDLAARGPAPTMRDGTTVVVPVVGQLWAYDNWLLSFFGGTALSELIATLGEIAADESVAHVVLEVDSPGGGVAKVMETVQAIHALTKAGKKVTAWISGLATSGAYWIASAAQNVFINDATTMVGSIGVVATHVDVSRAEEARGVKTTEIVAGKYKRIASNYAPLSEGGRASMQEQVDAIYSAFVESVAVNRGTNVGDVVNRMADGRIFVGRDAVGAGLVDGFATFGEILHGAASAPRGATQRASLRTSSDSSTSLKGEPMKTSAPNAEASTLFWQLLEQRHGFAKASLGSAHQSVANGVFAAATFDMDAVVAGDALWRRDVVVAAERAAALLRADGCEPDHGSAR